MVVCLSNVTRSQGILWHRLCLHKKTRPSPSSILGGFLISYHIYVFFLLLSHDQHDNAILIGMRYPFQFTSRLISHRNEWLFRIYIIPSQNFVPEGNSRSGTTTGVNPHQGDSPRHDLWWWYHETNTEPQEGTGLQYFAKRNEMKRNGTLRNGTLRNGYNTMLHHTLSRVPRIPLKAEDL